LEALATLTGEVDEEPVAEGSGAPLPEACKQCGGETMVSPTDVCPRCGGSGDEPRPAAFPERIEVIAGTVPGQAYGVWYPVGDCDVSDYDTWTYAPVPAAQPLPEGEKCEPCERCGGTGWLEEDDEYQRPVDRACSDCTQPVAEVASTDGEDLRLALNAVFNRWADQRYADSVPLNGCEKAKVRATAAAFRNAADYVLDSDPTDTAPNPPSVTDQSSDQGGGG
jgi:hypothetical protein